MKKLNVLKRAENHAAKWTWSTIEKWQIAIIVNAYASGFRAGQLFQRRLARAAADRSEK